MAKEKIPLRDSKNHCGIGDIHLASYSRTSCPTQSRKTENQTRAWTKKTNKMITKTCRGKKRKQRRKRGQRGASEITNKSGQQEEKGVKRIQKGIKTDKKGLIVVAEIKMKEKGGK